MKKPKTDIESRKAALRARIEKLKRENAVLEKQIDRRTDGEKLAAIFSSCWKEIDLTAKAGTTV